MDFATIQARFQANGVLPTLYLSGPMSGKPGLNFTAFNEAARKLRLFGFPVINPADFGPGQPLRECGGPGCCPAGQCAERDERWVTALARDLPLIAAADVIVLLDGYLESKGARLETATAISFGRPTVHYANDAHAQQTYDFFRLFFDDDEIYAVAEADTLAESARELIAQGLDVQLLVSTDRQAEDEDEDEDEGEGDEDGDDEDDGSDDEPAAGDVAEAA